MKFIAQIASENNIIQNYFREHNTYSTVRSLTTSIDDVTITSYFHQNQITIFEYVSNENYEMSFYITGNIISIDLKYAIIEDNTTKCLIFLFSSNNRKIYIKEYPSTIVIDSPLLDEDADIEEYIFNLGLMCNLTTMIKSDTITNTIIKMLEDFKFVFFKHYL